MKTFTLFHSRPQFLTKIIRYLKTFIICFVIGAILTYGVVLNISHEQKIQREQQIQLEMKRGSDLEQGVVLDAAADIIKRDGKLPLKVAKKYALWIYEAGAKYNVDPLLILSVMAIESGFKYNAISPTGPIGLLQIAASWHRDKTTSVALFDPKHNINVGTQILREYSDKSMTDVETLLRYNGSLGKAPVYAVKVLSKKNKYETEIMDAVVRSI